MDIVFMIGRVLFAVVFLANGLNHFSHITAMSGYAASKKVPAPRFVVALSGLVLLVGGLGILTWKLVPLAIILLGGFLLITTFWMHRFWNEKDEMLKMVEMQSFLKNTALLGALLMFAYFYS